MHAFSVLIVPTMKTNYLKPLNIGGVISSPNLVLAPMSGVTNSAFRRLLREENGAALGLVMTEFISIEALSRQAGRSIDMMKFEEYERPIAIQIFGYDIERMVISAKMVEDTGAEIIDINCGCPVPKVVRRGGGCELMRQVDHLGKLLHAVSSTVQIPLTLKIRSGWSENSINALEVGNLAVESGVKMLTIHGRTREQLYRGSADWKIIGEVASKLPIPVIGSGDIVDGKTALEGFKEGVAGLMIGRGAMENPWIFKDIYNEFMGIESEQRPYSEIPRVLLRYLELLLMDMPPKGAIGKMKQLISQSTRRIPRSSELRRDLCRECSLDQMKVRLEDWKNALDDSSSSVFTFNSEIHADPESLSRGLTL